MSAVIFTNPNFKKKVLRVWMESNETGTKYDTNETMNAAVFSQRLR